MSGHPPTLPAVTRCMTLLRLLVEKGQTSLMDARKAYNGEWTQRSYDRDLQTLREAGVEVKSLGSRGNGLATVVKFIGFKGEKRSRRKKAE